MNGAEMAVRFADACLNARWCGVLQRGAGNGPNADRCGSTSRRPDRQLHGWQSVRLCCANVPKPCRPTRNGGRQENALSTEELRRMLQKFFHFLLAAGLACPVAAYCANVSVEGNVLVVSGELVVSDERSFFEPFEQQAIGVVRFEDCLGGQFGPYDALKGLIESHRLATEAKGVVASGCAFAFMAGYPRRFVDNARRDTQLIFHGAFRRDNGQPLAQGMSTEPRRAGTRATARARRRRVGRREPHALAR